MSKIIRKKRDNIKSLPASVLAGASSLVEVAPSGGLGSIANFVSAGGVGGGLGVVIPDDPLLCRFAMQSAARELLPSERVSHCLRTPIDAAGHVAIKFDCEHESAFYGGLQTCGSVWACPVCSSKISERRREEIRLLVERAQSEGCLVVMLTWTVRHKFADDLAVTLAGLLAAHRRLKQGRAFQNFKEEVGFVGTVRSLEVTWGANGWHPHLHEVWILEPSDSPAWRDSFFESWLTRRWSEMVARSGLRDVNEHGLQFSRDKGDLGVYLSKLGNWDVSAELTKAHVKRSRAAGGGRSVAQLLSDYAFAGDSQAGYLWRDYARLFKGKNHLRWSPGLRARFLPDLEDLSDEELAAAQRETSIDLVNFTRPQWRVIVANDIRGDLLQVAQSGDPGEVWDFLGKFGLKLEVDDVIRPPSADYIIPAFVAPFETSAAFFPLLMEPLDMGERPAPVLPLLPIDPLSAAVVEAARCRQRLDELPTTSGAWAERYRLTVQMARLESQSVQAFAAAVAF